MGPIRKWRIRRAQKRLALAAAEVEARNMIVSSNGVVWSPSELEAANVRKLQAEALLKILEKE